MGGLDLSPVGLLTLLLNLLFILFSLSVHESAHAWMADRLGDPTGRMLGRITLNPLPHIDPLGTLLMPAVLSLLGAPVFGWAKPVPMVPRHFRKPRRDEALVGAAGPLSNLALALLSTALLGGLLLLWGKARFWADFQTPYSASWWLSQLGVLNVVLAGFNLIPIPPLDGSWILSALLPRGGHLLYERLRAVGPILLLLLFFTPLSALLRPLYVALYLAFVRLPLEVLSVLAGP